jgi:hypothetical protein
MDCPPAGDGRELVCGVVLLRADGAALLQLRDDKPEIRDPGIWVFPGGASGNPVRRWKKVPGGNFWKKRLIGARNSGG